MDITAPAAADVSTLAPPTWVDEIREGLLAHAFLFDDPRGYTAGVHDTLAEVESVLVGHARNGPVRSTGRP